MIFYGVEIDPEDICEVIPWHKRVLLRPSNAYWPLASNLGDKTAKFFIVLDDVDDETMNWFKFEHIRKKRMEQDPLDRVADFEWKDGIRFDFDKRDRLIKQRMSGHEINEEIKAIKKEIDWRLKNNINCDELKREFFNWM